VAHIVGLVGSEGVSGAENGRGVAPEGVSSSVWAVYGWFLLDSADSATKCLEVVGVGGVVMIIVDVVVDGCDMAVDVCDVGCDEGTGGEVSVENMEGMGSGMSWSELEVGLGVIPFLGHSFSNASQRCSHVSFCVAVRFLHHKSA
jgi:hypothetical protein